MTDSQHRRRSPHRRLELGLAPQHRALEALYVDLHEADVVFIDEDPGYMRITDANADETRSVNATPDNKRRLTQWAMRVKMEGGSSKEAKTALEFALSLKPDCIFLLSDGEFQKQVEEFLVDANRVENLFGESSRISIVHTISYHSKEGAAGMQRIAAQNGGPYRHVPKPQ